MGFPAEQRENNNRNANRFGAAKRKHADGQKSRKSTFHISTFPQAKGKTG